MEVREGWGGCVCVGWGGEAGVGGGGEGRSPHLAVGREEPFEYEREAGLLKGRQVRRRNL